MNLYTSFVLYCLLNLPVDAYKAAVVEYKPLLNASHTPEQILQANTQEYINIIAGAASNDLDILIFPEYGLATLQMPTDRNGSKPYLLQIPPIGTNPCLNQSIYSSSQIRDLSCAAKTHNVYIVINTGEIRECLNNTEINSCPEDGVWQYNANIVFNREGTIISKCLKRQLYLENQFNEAPDNQNCTFATDFGVKFGQFISFDINYKEPAIRQSNKDGIRNFIFTAAWFDASPFVMAPQVLSMWAFSTESNLLASGYHRPEGGQLGSGIFSGFCGLLNHTYDPLSGTKIVYSEVPSVPEDCIVSNKTEQTEDIIGDHFWLRENLENYTTAQIFPMGSPVQICTTSNFCCEILFTTNTTPKITDNNIYRLFAFDGTRTAGDGTELFSWKVCAVIHCLNETIESCTENEKIPTWQNDAHFFQFLQITGTPYISNDQYPLPALNAMDRNFQLIPGHLLQLDMEGDTSILTMNDASQTNIKTLGFIQRIHSNEK